MGYRIVLFLFALCLAGCGPQPESPAPASTVGQPDPTGPLREFNLQGMVVSVDREGNSALIDHQEVEGLMGAMTMRFPIPDAADLEKVEEGDQVTATLYQRPSDSVYWIGNIEVLDAGE